MDGQIDLSGNAIRAQVVGGSSDPVFLLQVTGGMDGYISPTSRPVGSRVYFTLRGHLACRL